MTGVVTADEDLMNWIMRELGAVLATLPDGQSHPRLW